MSESDQTFFDEVATEELPPKPKRRRGRTAILWIVGILVVILAVVGGVVAYYGTSVKAALDSVHREPGMMPTQENRPEPVPAPEGQSERPMNFLLLGSDTRSTDERGRSDVMIVVHIPADRGTVHLISIPRDYWVEIPGHGQAKVNAAYAWGGMPLAVETVEELLDVPMDHAAIIDFDGFTRVIDAVGGVTVYNRHASSSGGHHFPEGEITLNGEEALVFVRERKNLPDGDFGRAERQRDVIKATLGKLMSRDVLTNPGRFRDAVTTLGTNFTVDDGLTNDVMVDLAMSMRVRGPGDIRTFMVPVGPFGTSSDGQSYVSVDEAGLAELREALREDRVNEFAGTR